MPWETYAASDDQPHSERGFPLTPPIDPLYHRLNIDHRSPKDASVLRTAAKAERYRGIYGRHYTHPHPVAIDRFLSGALRNLRAVRGFLRNDRRLRGERPGGGTLYKAYP